MALLSCPLPSCSGNFPLFEPTGAARPSRITSAVGADRNIDGDFRVPRENPGLGEVFRRLGKQRNPSSASDPGHLELLLHACSRSSCLEGGRQLHAQTVKRGFELTQFSCTSLLDLYIKCENLVLARQMFDTSAVRESLVSWNHMISGYCRSGLIDEALLLFLDLRDRGFKPDQFTFSSIFHVLHRRKELALGRQFHSLSVKFGLGEEEFICNSLIRMYAGCGTIADAVQVFEQFSAAATDPIAWNSIMARLVETELHGRALEVFGRMQRRGVEPTPPTLCSALCACAGLRAVRDGKQAHAQVFVRGFSHNTILETALVDAYAKCGEIGSARKVFENMTERSVVTWNTMIRACSQGGLLRESFYLFTAMRISGVLPDEFTFTGLLLGADSAEGLRPVEFKALHSYMIKLGLARDPFTSSYLITRYADHKSLADAKQVFEDADRRDLGVWSSLISAFTKNQEADEALRLFIQMLERGVESSQFIYSSLTMSCAHLPSLDRGTQIHARILKDNLQPPDVATGNSLLTMFSSSGCIGEAKKVFDAMENPSPASFNSMISALARHGMATDATRLFDRMRSGGPKPDGITFLALLSAFSHAGRAEEGLHLLRSMKEEHGVEPSYRHYACTVDMLARAGEMGAAVGCLRAMPFEPAPELWRMVLGACRKFGNVEVGKTVAEMLLGSEPGEVGTYVLLANMYAGAGRWREAAGVMRLMEDGGMRKDDAFSWIEVRGRTHVFRAQDRSHQRSGEMYEMLRLLHT